MCVLSLSLMAGEFCVMWHGVLFVLFFFRSLRIFRTWSMTCDDIRKVLRKPQIRRFYNSCKICVVIQWRSGKGKCLSATSLAHRNIHELLWLPSLQALPFNLTLNCSLAARLLSGYISMVMLVQRHAVLLASFFNVCASPTIICKCLCDASRVLQLDSRWRCIMVMTSSMLTRRLKVKNYLVRSSVTFCLLSWCWLNEEYSWREIYWPLSGHHV